MLIIAPWNYPVQLLLEPLAAAARRRQRRRRQALRAGPGTPRPCSTDLLRTYLDDAVQVVEGGPEVATELLEQRWDHIFFTGSTRVGRVVAEAAAKHLTPVTLELGGKSPAIVHRSANLEVAGRRIAWGKFLNAGQTCIAPDYVLVDESVQDELIEHIRDRGAATSTATIPRPATTTPASSTTATSTACPACSPAGASPPSAAGPTPTPATSPRPCWSTPPTDADILQEEIFGPLLPVLPVTSVADAIDRINASPSRWRSTSSPPTTTPSTPCWSGPRPAACA